METVTARDAEAVGLVVYVEIQIEGLPVKAVVDSGAQSSIMSRDLLHKVARHMQSHGCSIPKLAQPSVKLFGRSGNGCSELMITAEANLKLMSGSCTV